MKFLAWLDSWNGRRDGQELAGGMGVVAGMLVGSLLTAAAMSHEFRLLVEGCLHG